MTSKTYSKKFNPFKNLMIHSFKNSIFVSILMLLILIIYTVYKTGNIAMEPRFDSNLYPNYFDTVVDQDSIDVKYLLFNGFSELNIVVILFSMVMALILFNFIFSKKAINFYFNLGITRKKQFLSRYISGLISLILPINLAMVFSMIKNISAMGYNIILLKAVIYIIIGLSIVAFVAYSISVLALICANNIIEGIIYIGSVIFGVSIIMMSFDTMSDKLLYGSILEKIIYKYSEYNPLTFFVKELQKFSTITKSLQSIFNMELKIPPLPLVLWSIFGILIFLVSLRVFQKKKLDLIGEGGNCKILNIYAEIILIFFVFLIMLKGTYFGIGKIYAVFMAVIISIIGYLFLEFCILFSFKKLRKTIYKLPISLAPALILSIIFLTGGFGYSSKVPDISEIESISLITMNDDSYVSSFDYKYSSDADKKLIINFHKSIIDDNSYGSIKSTSVNDKTMIGNYEYIIYNLKNGEEIIRSYTSISVKSFKEKLKLLDSDGAKERVKLSFTSDNKDTYNYFFDSDIYFSNEVLSNLKKVSLEKDVRKGLLEAIYKDYKNLNYKERELSTNKVLGIITFGDIQEADVDEIDSSGKLYGRKIFITEDYINTIDYLKENHLYEYFQDDFIIEKAYYKKPTEISVGSDINILRTNYIDGYSNIEELTEINKENFNEVLNKSYSRYFVGENLYMVYLEVKGSNGETKKITRFIPEKEAPEYIK